MALSDQEIITQIKELKSTEDLDGYFNIEAYSRGGFVNHYRLLKMVGQYMVDDFTTILDSYLLKRNHAILIKNKRKISSGLIQHLQYMLDYMDGFVYNISDCEDGNQYGFEEIEKIRIKVWEYVLANIKIINMLFPIFKSILFSNFYANEILRRSGINEYLNRYNYGKILLSRCNSNSFPIYKKYVEMHNVLPRPKISHPTEMEGILCSISKRTREKIGLSDYPVRDIKQFYNLKRRRAILKTFKLLDPFFVQCIQLDFIKFKGDDIVLDEFEIQNIIDATSRDDGFNETMSYLVRALLCVFGKRKLPDNWIIFEPVNLGPVKLPKENFYYEWITHLQTNLQDWKNKFNT